MHFYHTTSTKGSKTMSESTTQVEQTTTKADSTSSRLKSPPRLRSRGLLGSARKMQRDPLKFLREARQYGDIVRMRFVFSDAYLIYHPDSVKHVLQENNRNYNKDIFAYKLLRPFLGQGLLLNDGESWLHQRRLMQPAFFHKRIASYATIMADATDDLLVRWQSHNQQDSSLDIAEEMMRLTLGIVGQTLFSIDLSDETNTIGPAVTTLLNLV